MYSTKSHGRPKWMKSRQNVQKTFFLFVLSLPTYFCVTIVSARPGPRLIKMSFQSSQTEPRRLLKITQTT